MHAAATITSTPTTTRHAACVKTIVFTDIESSTELTAALGDDAWVDLLIAHDTLVEACAAEFDGTVVKSLGDGFMLAFPSPAAAADFCINLRRRLDDDLALGELRVRAGIHCGSVVPRRNDFFGTTVNTAARVSGQAIGGQTLVSEEVAKLLDVTMTVPFGEVELKGLAGTYQLSSLVA